MIIVYLWHPEFRSWDYQCTLHWSNGDISKSLYDFILEYEELNDSDTGYDLMLYEMIKNRYYVGANLRFYYVDEDPTNGIR